MCCRLFEAGPSEVERLVTLDGGGTTVADTHTQPTSPAVEVLGLPATVSTEEVVSFLTGVELSEAPDRITLFSSQDNSRGAIVLVANSESQAQALSRNQALLDGRPVQVLPYYPRTDASTTAVAVAHDRPAQPIILLNCGQYQHISVAQPGQTYPFRTDGSTLKLRGLPYSAGDADVITFFEGVLPYHKAFVTYTCQYPAVLFVCCGACHSCRLPIVICSASHA